MPVDTDTLGSQQSLATQSLQGITTPSTLALSKPDKFQHIKAAFANVDFMDDAILEFSKQKEKFLQLKTVWII